MAKNLNDTQRLILAAAAAHDDLRALPLPDTLRAPAHIVKKTLATLIKEGLLCEATALPEDAVWTASEGGGRVTLVVTPAGLAAIGVEPEAAPAAVSLDKPAKGPSGGATHAEATPRTSTADRGGKMSKQDAVLGLLRRPEGASVAEMMAATGWQAHSVRGFLAGAVKRRLGFEVTSAKGEDGERRYRVTTPAADGDEPA